MVMQVELVLVWAVVTVVSLPVVLMYALARRGRRGARHEGGEQAARRGGLL
jgi:hypothetical protein